MQLFRVYFALQLFEQPVSDVSITPQAVCHQTQVRNFQTCWIFVVLQVRFQCLRKLTGLAWQHKELRQAAGVFSLSENPYCEILSDQLKRVYAIRFLPIATCLASSASVAIGNFIHPLSIASVLAAEAVGTF